jgi:small subunit ribosomal protein S8
MSFSDPIGDMLTRIRNGQMARKTSVRTPASKFRASVLEVLKREGYIRDFHDDVNGDGHAELVIELKYFEGTPVISKIRRVSKPGRRVYSKIADLGKVANGLGISVLSTPRGVLSDAEARAENVGGEVLCEVF